MECRIKPFFDEKLTLVDKNNDLVDNSAILVDVKSGLGRAFSSPR